MTTWEAQIQAIPPGADWLKRMGEVTKREILVTWWRHLNQVLGTTPKAQAKRILEVTFIQEHVDSVEDLRARAHACIVTPLLPQTETAARYSKGRRTGGAFFSRHPGLGLLAGDTPEWLDLRVKGIFGCGEDLTLIRLEEVATRPEDNQTELLEAYRAARRALHALTKPFDGPDGHLDRHYTAEAAKTLLAMPEPRLYQLWKQGLMVVDTPASLAGDPDMVAVIALDAENAALRDRLEEVKREAKRDGVEYAWKFIDSLISGGDISMNRERAFIIRDALFAGLDEEVEG